MPPKKQSSPQNAPPISPPQAAPQAQLPQQPRSQNAPKNTTDISDALRLYIDNEHLPEDIDEKYWSLFSKTLKLCCIRKTDEELEMIEWELLRMEFIEDLPANQNTLKLVKELHQVGMEYRHNLFRAREGAIGGERLAETQDTHVNVDKSFAPNPDNAGFLSRGWSAIKGITGGH